jgi:transcriptional regulator of nitric oxide reductase
MSQFRAILLGALCAALIIAVHGYAATQYTVTDLGALQPVAVIDGPVVFGNMSGVPVVWQAGQTKPRQSFVYISAE